MFKEADYMDDGTWTWWQNVKLIHIMKSKEFWETYVSVPPATFIELALLHHEV